MSSPHFEVTHFPDPQTAVSVNVAPVSQEKKQFTTTMVYNAMTVHARQKNIKAWQAMNLEADLITHLKQTRWGVQNVHDGLLTVDNGEIFVREHEKVAVSTPGTVFLGSRSKR